METTLNKTEEVLRDSVISYLHWDGENRKKLTENYRRKLYLLCDGFGSIDEETAKEIEWDWSHVRDSSMSALSNVQKALTSLMNTTRNGLFIIGQFSWRYKDVWHYADLVELSEFDKEQFRIVGLKEDEKLFRYSTDTTMVTGITPVVKINVKKKLVYFLTDRGVELDCLDFETRGIRLGRLNFEEESIVEYRKEIIKRVLEV